MAGAFDGRRAETQARSLCAELEPLLPFTRDLNDLDVEEYWIIQIPVGLLFEAWRVQARLADAVARTDIQALAFLCRTALELHVWGRYVASSPKAAKRFHQDAYVDAVEVFRLIGKVFEVLPSEWHATVRESREGLMPEFDRVLVRDKVGLSLDSLRAMKHLNVGTAAGEVGYGHVFSLWNPILSKLVHATAYNVLVAGKGMNVIGTVLVDGIARELRAAVVDVNGYLRSNGFPQFDRSMPTT